MAGNDKKGSLPSFSPTPTLDDLFNGNTTIGRIKSMQCMRDGADLKACAREELKKKQQRYADHASGKDPLPPSESLALRSDIDRLSQVVNPGSQNAWPPNSEAETAYLADKAMAERRAANDMSIWQRGPVPGAPQAAGRLLNAPEWVIENLGIIGDGITAAFGFGGRGGGRGRSAKPASNEPKTSRSTSPSPKPASPGNGTYVEKAAKPPPKVTATARIGDREFKGTNQQARENPNANQRTAAADQIEASKKFRAGDPNTNMENAHAEIEAMQKASDAGLTNGADMTIELSGQNMCTYCRSNVATMANEIGLNRLVVQGPQGETSIWVKGVGWIQKGW